MSWKSKSCFLPPISLQFISLAKLSPPVPHLTALHCKPHIGFWLRWGGGLDDDGGDDGDGDDVDVGVDGADGNGDAGDAGDDVDRDYDDDLAVGGCGGGVVLLQELCCYH